MALFRWLARKRPRESRQAIDFQKAYGRALGSPDPDDQVAAAQHALSLLETLEPWPFPGHMPTARVAHGILLGSLAGAYSTLKSRDPVTCSELAVSTNEEAMKFLREDDGEAWTTLMMNSSVAYAERISGDRGANVERAIALTEAALRKLDRARHGRSWLQAKGNLSGFLAERTQGDPADNMERAIATQQEMLDAIPPRSEPRMWAMAQGDLGAKYLRRVRGVRSENVEAARSKLEQALERIPKSSAPEEWAHKAVHLASAYGDSLLVAGPGNAARAFDLLTQAIEIYSAADWPERWAGAQISLGSLWVSQPGGNPLENTEKAIRCFERALTVFTADRFPHDHAMASRNLAMARLGRRTGRRPENVAAAVAAARATAAGLSRTTAPMDWAHARNVLGIGLIETRSGDRAASIEEAMSCFRDVLSVVTLDSAPEKWAMAIGNLAKAYAERLEGDPAENIEEAIRLEEEVIAALDPASYPDEWVSAMHNLAFSYSERMTGSRADNCEKAVALVESALVLRPAYSHPEARSELLELLGTAYLDRLRGDRDDNLERAVDAYRSAQQLRSREAGQVEWLRLDQKMLTAQLRYQDTREDGSDPDARQEQPTAAEFIAGLEAKADSISPDDDLPTWVNGQIAVGDMYTRLAPDSTDDFESLMRECQDNVRKAIAIYENALAAVSRTEEPARWGLVSKRIAARYELLHLLADWRRKAMPEDDHDPEDLERGACDSRQALDAAAQALTQAMAAGRSERNPRQHLTDAVMLGRIHVERRDWAQANRALSSAARAADALLADVEVNEEELRDTLKALGELAALAPYVFAVTGDVDRALETAEAAKARLLAKALTLEALNLPAVDRRRLEDLQEEIKKHEAKLASPLLVDRMPPLDAVMRCRDELKSFVAGEAEQSAANMIEEIVTDGSVLVFPFLAETGSCIVIAYREAGAVKTGITRVDAGLDFDIGMSQAFRQALGPSQADWQDVYFRRQRKPRPRDWDRTLRAIGPALGPAIAEPLLKLLDECGVRPGVRLRILPQGPLGVLPIGLALDSEQGSVLLDQYPLSLSPSLRVLAAATARSRAEERDMTLVFCTYAENLGFLGFEADMVTSWFASDAVDLLADSEATKANILQTLPARKVWHFAAHGEFDVSEPTLSGVKLANGERLTVAELLETRRLTRPSLVVLSACETGLYGLDDLPNEFIGLPAAFLQAGAMGVVATLWPVRDQPSALLLSRFYELYVVDRLPPHAALRGAQLWLRESSAADLQQAVLRWNGQERVSSDHTAKMLEAIDAWDRWPNRPPGSPYAAPAFWGGFVYYGA